MTVLGIETATLVCGAALVRDGSVVADAWVEERSVHAERLFGLIDDVLSRGACLPGNVNALAVSIGPGSFTGLRIGLSAAKGLHMALGIPVVAVPTLKALARRGVPAFAGRPGHILAALDARRDEVYSQLFALDRGVLRERGEAEARTVRDLVVGLPAGELLLTGDARDKVAAFLELPGSQGGAAGGGSGNGAQGGSLHDARGAGVSLHGTDGGGRGIGAQGVSLHGTAGGGVKRGGPGRSRVSLHGAEGAPAVHGIMVAEASLARCSAAEVALIGEAMAERGEFSDAATLEPQYVKDVFLNTPH